MNKVVSLPAKLPDQYHVDPQSLRCPSCNASPGSKCVRRSRSGARRTIKYLHSARHELAADLRADRLDERRIEQGE